MTKPSDQEPPTNQIGSLGESSLHAALKAWYAQPGDQIEALVDGYYIDIVRDELMIEIQTRSFAKIKGKLQRLVQQHPVRLVHPIAEEKWIIRRPRLDLPPTSRRRSPKHGRLEQLFVELVRIPGLITHPNFSIEVLFTREEEILLDDGRGSWRRKGWSIYDRRLLEVTGRRLFTTPSDFLALLPSTLSNPFTVKELAKELSLPVRIAQKMTYSMRQMKVIEIAGKRGRAYLYTKASHLTSA